MSPCLNYNNPWNILKSLSKELIQFYNTDNVYCGKGTALSVTEIHNCNKVSPSWSLKNGKVNYTNDDYIGRDKAF